MNCDLVQRRLLSLSDPESLPDNLRAHLAYCEACSDWHDHLLVLERHVPLLPIPRSNGKARLMRRLLHDKALPGPGDGVRVFKRSQGTRSISDSPTLRSRTVLLGVAAALLVIALGWLGLQKWLQTAAVPPSEPASNLAVLLTALAPLSRGKNAAPRLEAAVSTRFLQRRMLTSE